MVTNQPFFTQPISQQVWEMKYQMKDYDGKIHDEDVTDTWWRIAQALAVVEKDPVLWQNKFYSVLREFKFLPAGRITAGAGTGRNVTLVNCFVTGTIEDSMRDIFTKLSESALTMQQGGGIGMNFSTIRPKGAEVKGVAADASGPLSFMDCWDSMCRTVMSAGCFTADMRVLTDNGYVPIKDVKVGDKVMTHKGLKTVTTTFDNGKKAVNRLFLETGRSIVVTPNHNMLTIDSDGKIVKKELSSLKKGDTLLMPELNIAPKNENLLSSDVSYVMGHIFANGNYNYRNDKIHHVRIAFSHRDTGILALKKVKEIFDSLNLQYVQREGDGACEVLTLHGDSARTIESWCGRKPYAHEIEFPENVTPVPFIAGLFDGDGDWLGHKTGPRIRLTSEKMVDRVQDELFKIGIASVKNVIPKENGWKTQYGIQIPTPYFQTKFLMIFGHLIHKVAKIAPHKGRAFCYPVEVLKNISRINKLERGKISGKNRIGKHTLKNVYPDSEINNFIPIRITDVISEGKEQVYDIEVEDTHTYVIENIEVSNSRRGAMMATMLCNHPDIEDFIKAKQDGTRFRMFNLSVLVTDAFMEAVKNDTDWDLVFGDRVYKTVRAVDLWNKIMDATFSYAEPGVLFIDRINELNNLNYCETIMATNPCVRGDTQILTDQGYVKIEDHVDQNINVWNGYEFSNVTIKVTGLNQKMKRIRFSDGSSLDCTHYHKFILSDNNRIEALNLKIGDKLVKSEWPVIEGYETLQDAYEQGFFTGDGWVKSVDGSRYIGLYGEKKNLIERFKQPLSIREYAISGGYEGTDTSETKLYLNYGNVNWFDKNTVPDTKYTIESRKKWLEGLIDSDGHVTKDGSCQISAKDFDFLMRVKFMLNTIGVTASVNVMKEHYRLTISPYNMTFLNLNIRFDSYKPNRDASRFIKVVSVEDVEDADIVYCFTEPKNHSGVFGGVVTAQCGEQPLPPYGACVLGSMNLTQYVIEPFTNKAIFDYESFREDITIAIRMLDNVNDVTKFPISQQEKSAKDKRRIGLGVTGLADTLIMLGFIYGSDESLVFVDEIMSKMADYSYMSSAGLANEKGPFPAYDKELYNPKVILSDYVRETIKELGMRNSHVLSIAPTGTISLYANNISSGIEPVFALSYDRKILLPDGTHHVETVKDYAVVQWGDKPFNECFVTAQTLKPLDHIKMQATVQKYIDTSISKTVNCPVDISFEDFKDVYMEAWELGCKGCTTYRPNDVTGSILSVSDESTGVDDNKMPEAEGGACYYDPATGTKTCDQ